MIFILILATISSPHSDTLLMYYQKLKREKEKEKTNTYLVYIT